MESFHEDDRLDNSFIRPTRFVRNSDVQQESAALQPRKEPTFHDFILLATRICPTDPHHAGHKTNIILTGGSPLIGRGSSFAVYKLPTSEHCNGFRAKFVAVKSPLAAQQTNLSSDSFKRQLKDAYFELHVLSHPPLRNHNNIIELLGISWEPSPLSLANFEGSESAQLSLWPVLVLEHSPLGSILEMFEDIVENDSDPLTIESKINISIDVARGLKALHDCSIAHSDIKCENVLMFFEPPRLTAKIADFGCALSDLTEHKWLRGFTEPWNAPEVVDSLKGTELLLADVYSLGFVIWRIMTDGKDPFVTPSVVATRGQLSLKDFKMQDTLWELACSDIHDSGIWDGTTRESQPFHKATKGLKVKGIVEKIKSVVKRGDNGTLANASRKTSRSPTAHGPAQDMRVVFRNSLRRLPNFRDLSVVLKHLIGIQNSVCEIFDPEPLEVETKKGFGHLPDHIKAVMNLNTSDAYMFSSTELSMLNMSNPDDYSSLISHMASFDFRVRDYLVQSMKEAQRIAPKCEAKDITRALFVYYFEVEYDLKEALEWLVVAADLGDYVAQGIVYRLFKTENQPLPRDDAVIQLWLWNAAIRCSPIALEDLKSVNPVSYEQAVAAITGKYGGIGIDVFQEFEVTMRMVAYGAKEDVDSDSDDGVDYSDGKVHIVKMPDYPGWPGEILKGIGHGRCDKYSEDRGDFWEPTWEGQPHQTKSAGYLYRSDPEAVLQSTFRITEEGKMYWVSGFADSVLHYAANRGHLQLVKFICEKYNPDVNDTNFFLETPLLQACRSSHAGVAAYLISKGADPTISSGRGETPLHWVGAARLPDLEPLIKILIAGGASREVKARYPCELQRAFGAQEQIMSFRRRGNALEWQVDQGNRWSLEALLADGYGGKDAEWDAILDAARLAAVLLHYECLSLLIDRAVLLRGKLDPKITYDWLADAVLELNGGGHLYRRLRHGHQALRAFGATLRCLQKAGAKPLSQEDITDSQDQWRLTVLFRAIMNPANMECIRLLLDSGWSKEKEIKWTFMTHIQRAISWGDYDVFQLLLEQGFDPFEKTDHFDTGPECDAYMFCAMSERPNMRIVERLYSLGVPYFESSTISPFETAVRRGLFEMATFFLIKCGADINRFVPNPEHATVLGPYGKPCRTLLGSLISEYSSRSITSIRFLLGGFSSLAATGIHSNSDSIKPSFIVCEGSDQLSALHLAAGFTEETYEHVAPFLLPPLLAAFPGPEHIDAKDEFFQWTALHHSTKCGNHEAVRILLEAGAKHDIGDDTGIIPLQLAKNMLEDLKWTSKGRGGKSHIEDMRYRFSKVIRYLEAAAAKDIAVEGLLEFMTISEPKQ